MSKDIVQNMIKISFVFERKTATITNTSTFYSLQSSLQITSSMIDHISSKNVESSKILPIHFSTCVVFVFSTSLQSDPICGPKFVCVQIDRYAPISEDDLYEYTSRNFGHVLNCVLYQTRGYAFIEFKRLTDVHRALASTKNRIRGVEIHYRSRHDTSKITPPLCLTRLVHIGNFSLKDQEKVQSYFPQLQTFTVHQNCYGQTYILGQFDINDSIKLLLNRAFCLNGRVLSVFSDNEDRLTECNNYLLVRHVPFRLNDYHLLEYFSQYGRILNCYRYGQTDAYRIQYRDRKSLENILQFNRIHLIKGSQLQIENEQN